MSDTPEFLADRLKVEGDKTAVFFKGLSESQWDLSIYTENSIWKMREVLAHFVTAEKGFLKLFNNILAGGAGAAEDFDIDLYNANQQKKTLNVSAMDLIDQFISVRTEIISLVESLSEADLQKQGRHPFLGITSLSEMVKMVYRHNQIHYRDIKKLLP